MGWARVLGPGIGRRMGAGRHVLGSNHCTCGMGRMGGWDGRDVMRLGFPAKEDTGDP